MVVVGHYTYVIHVYVIVGLSLTCGGGHGRYHVTSHVALALGLPDDSRVELYARTGADPVTG